MKALEKTLAKSKRIRRIVDVLVGACEDNLADELGLDIEVDCYTVTEGLPTYAEDTISGHLIEYLQVNRIAEVRQVYAPAQFGSLPNNDFMFATKLSCRVLDRRKLVGLAKKLKAAQEVSQAAHIAPATGELTVHSFAIRFQLNTNMYDLLRLLLDDSESRRCGRSSNELAGQLKQSESLKHPESLVRDTANNVNRRVGDATGGQITNFLIVTAESIRVNPDFV